MFYIDVLDVGGPNPKRLTDGCDARDDFGIMFFVGDVFGEKRHREIVKKNPAYGGNEFVKNVVERLFHQFYEFAANGFWIGLAEDSASDDENVCTRFLAGEDVVEFDSAVDLNIEFRLERTQFANLVKAIRNEALAAESRVHGHDEHHVNDVEHVLDAFERCCRIDGNGGLDSEFCNLVQQTVEVVCGFGVHADDACACFCKFAHVIFGIFNHQMAIEREFGAFFDAGRNSRTKADVRDKVPVHDIQVNEACASVFDGLETIAEGEKVCVQDARSDDLFKHVLNIAK